VKWSPKLTNYLSLIFTGERRSLTDSLLSYVGLKDTYSGKTWGQVTKNGGTLQLSYDDGDAGFYVGGGATATLAATWPATPVSTPMPGSICGLTMMNIASCRPV
jgi:hypothetical protein